MEPPMTRFDGRHPFPVKVGDQIGDGIPRAMPGGFGRCGVAFTIGHGQKCLGPSDVGSGLGVGAADANEQLAFVVGERSEGIFVAARHRHSSPVRKSTEEPAAYSNCI